MRYIIIENKKFFLHKMNKNAIFFKADNNELLYDGESLMRYQWDTNYIIMP